MQSERMDIMMPGQAGHSLVPSAGNPSDVACRRVRMLQLRPGGVQLSAVMTSDASSMSGRKEETTETRLKGKRLVERKIVVEIATHRNQDVPGPRIPAQSSISLPGTGSEPPTFSNSTTEAARAEDLHSTPPLSRIGSDYTHSPVSSSRQDRATRLRRSLGAHSVSVSDRGAELRPFCMHCCSNP